MPPGDIRNCIAALADAEPLMTQLMQYRFPPGSGLDDHAFGNLFIAAMTAVTGDFEEAVRESNRVLAVRGQVLPATSVPLNLGAILESGRRLQGQVAISHAEEPIAQVTIEPADVRASSEALERILEADMVVIGPGSLFSSVLPNLLISDHPRCGGGGERRAGLRLQRGHPARRDRASSRPPLTSRRCSTTSGDQLFDYALLNGNQDARRPEGWLGQPVKVDERRLEELPVTVIEEDIVDVGNAHRHDPAKLAAALMRLHQEERAERRRPAPSGCAARPHPPSDRRCWSPPS